MTVLVSGGAGYIGAHVVRLLREAGRDVLVADDLSTGSASRVPGVPLLRVDLVEPASVGVLAEAMGARGVTSVVHFAAKKRVDESMVRPAWYFAQNVGGLANVLSAMELAGVDRFVFSSSAAVYGNPLSGDVPEDADLAPVNPYGESKLVGEWLVRDAQRAWGLRAASLRYFNVAGAGWTELGDPLVMNLVTMLLQARAHGLPPRVFGSDYLTRDGSCERDFVHVLDLAHAHLAALDYLDRDEREWDVFNVGTGTGSTVLEVVQALGDVAGWRTAPELSPRRAGDPARVVAQVERLTAATGWHAQAGLPEILASAWAAWQHDHPAM